MFARSRFYTPAFDLIPPRDWLGALAKLVRFLRRDDIKTVDALLAFVSRDYVTSRILAQLFDWMPRAKREDGLVYKSGSDWQAETGISEGQIKTRKQNGALAELGITWDVMRANKIPHSHYGFDADVFVKHVAKVCGVLACEVEAICYLRQMPDQPGYGSNQPNPPVESPFSLTELHKQPQLRSVNDSYSPAGKVLNFDDALVAKLVRAGLSRKDRPQKYAVLPMDVIDACIADTEEAQKQNAIKYTVRAYLRGALDNQLKGYRETPKLEADALDHAPTETHQSESCGDCGTVPHWFTGECGCTEGELPEASSDTDIVLSNGWTAERCWNATINQLELQLDRATFETWVAGSELRAVEDGVFVVSVQNAHQQEMLQHRLYRNIRRVLMDVIGTETDIRFEIKGKRR